MREEDKPFVCYKRGWAIKISPRNVAGWRAFGFWLASYLAITALYLSGSSGLHGSVEIAALVAFLAVTGVWMIVMVRWMMARSEVVDINALLELKREQERKGRRR